MLSAVGRSTGGSLAEDGDQAEALPRTRDVLHVYGVFSPPQPAHAMYMVHGAGAGVARCVCRYITQPL